TDPCGNTIDQKKGAAQAAWQHLGEKRKQKKAIPVDPRKAGMGFKPFNQIDSLSKTDYFILRADYFEMWFQI
ncbi:MAG: hypothetical protein RIB86_13020, partial [Imperialibacter sp.]